MNRNRIYWPLCPIPEGGDRGELYPNLFREIFVRNALSDSNDWHNFERKCNKGT